LHRLKRVRAECIVQVLLVISELRDVESPSPGENSRGRAKDAWVPAER
jgi:hypothetical protein